MLDTSTVKKSDRQNSAAVLKSIYSRDMEYFFGKMRKAIIKENIGKMTGVLAMDIVNDTAAEIEKWVIRFNPDSVILNREQVDAWDAKINIKKRLFIDCMLGQVDMMHAFSTRLFEIEGNLRLAMYMNLVFEMPRTYDKWFFILDHAVIPEKIRDLNLIYGFKIENLPPESFDDVEDDIPLEISNKISYRNIIFKNGACEIVPFNRDDYHVQFSTCEEALLNVMSGTLSFYDIFLHSQLHFEGTMGDVHRFQALFDQQAFPNRELKYLTLQNVFNIIHKMPTDIPPELYGISILFIFKGKESERFCLRIGKEGITLIPREEIKNVNAKITMSADTFYGLCRNEIDYMDAYENGDIIFQGEQNFGLLFNDIFSYRFTYEN